jgi:Lon protease-like protein
MKDYDLPLFPLRTVLFPGQALPLHIFEARYRQMIADCMEADATFGVVLIQEGMEVGPLATPYEVGTTAVIEDIERLPDGRMNIVTIGQERFQLRSYDVTSKPYLVGRVSPWPWSDYAPPQAGLKQAVRRRVEQYVGLLSQASETDISLDSIPQNPSELAALAAVILQIPPEQKQALLETPSVDELLRELDQLLREENRGLQLVLASTHLRGELDGIFSWN